MKQHFNRIIAGVVALLLCVGLLAVPGFAEETRSGVCGENLTWSFADGRLTISGSGDMTDYNQVDLPPWYDFREQIYYISLPEGLTGVGDMAFYDCYQLTAVTMPSTVREIGRMAFCQCKSLAILSLNNGLETIDRSAFELCEMLQDLRLPNSVTTLGYHAFYTCSSLRYVKIPASVTKMDMGVFAYCENLIGAEIEASLDVVPSWTFYGCGSLTGIALHQQITGAELNAFFGCANLTTVYYAGTQENAEQLREQIGADSEEFLENGVITDETPEGSGSVTELEFSEESGVYFNDTTVEQTENSTISTSTSMENGEKEVAVDAIIVTEEGWQEVLDAIESGSQQAGENTVEVNLYIPAGGGVPAELIEAVAGSNVNVNVQTGDGAQFAVSGDLVEAPKDAGEVFFSYNATRMAVPDYSQLSGAAAYQLKFSHSSEVRVEVLIRLPVEFARSTATLYQGDGKTLVMLQSVLVDSQGYAHFYLANVDAQGDYRIGINDANVEEDSVIVPEEFYGEYGITSNYPDFSQYVITGERVAMGVSAGQLIWVILGVLAACTVCIGVIMYMWNKKRLKNGYIPDIDEEDIAQ